MKLTPPRMHDQRRGWSLIEHRLGESSEAKINFD